LIHESCSAGIIAPKYYSKSLEVRAYRMKNNIALLILSALVANASSGNPSQMTSNRSNAILHSYYPGGRVWLEQVQQKMNVDSNGVLLNGYDVVAYFTQHRAIKGTTKYQTTYKGAIYYFSSATDLATFKQNPSKYIPQYGGFCAHHVPSGDCPTPPHPRARWGRFVFLRGIRQSRRTGDRP